MTISYISAAGSGFECTYRPHSRWWHGTASRSFALPWFPSSIGIPWPSAWGGDWDQLLCSMGLVWSRPSKRLWNAKMNLIVQSSSWKRPIPGLPSWSLQLSLQECPSSSMLRHLLPQVWGHTASPLVLSGPPERNWMRAISVMVEGINLTFGMYWGVHRQHPLVMAYRGWTNRNWIIEVTMCCPERTK